MAKKKPDPSVPQEKPKPAPAGRPRVFLDEAKQKGLLDALSAGAPPEIACNYAGASERTFHRLMRRHEDRLTIAEAASMAAHGSEERWLEFVAPEDQAEAIFCQSIKRTISAFVVRQLLKVEKGGANWQSKAWLLERRYPEKFGRKYSGGPNEPGDPDDPSKTRRVHVYVPNNGRGPKPPKPAEPSPAAPALPEVEKAAGVSVKVH